VSQRLSWFGRIVVALRGRPPVPRAVRAGFWDGVRSGLGVREAAAAAGVHHSQAMVWFRQAGGVVPPVVRAGRGRYLSLAEREEIAVGLVAGLALREIARRLGRPASTVSREIARNSTRGRYRYRAVAAQVRAEERARRPKPAKLAGNGELHRWVQRKLKKNWSPEQISARLAVDFPDRPEMRVSHETIYQALYVQGRGALRRELTVHLRTGRALRKPRRTEGERRGKIPDMVLIADRPPEADDRAVPGHWEGDQIAGRAGKSQIGTLVERTTRYTMLVPMPGGKGAVPFAAAVIPVIADLPGSLRRSLTWDQGKEMALHKQISIAAGIDIYFCDPHSPWQRPTNENTNGLLRQYFPKGTDLSVHSARHLQDVADELNGRPRKVLGWKTPAEAMAALLDSQPD
jgi:transposase, IS30 family